MGESKTTTDHDEIKNWAEERGGKPSKIRGTGNDADEGMLRINFPGYAETNLEDISWEEFFDEFDNRGLKFLYQDETKGGKVSRFSKFVK